jgi:altronate dehydratase large subunit
MACNIDMDVSPIFGGSKSVEECGKELFEEVLRVAEGKKVKAELLGINDIGISRLCNYV